MESEHVCPRPSRPLESPEEGGGSLTSVHMLPLTPKGQGGSQVWEGQGSGVKWPRPWRVGQRVGAAGLLSHTFVSDPAQDYRGKLAAWCLSFLVFQGSRAGVPVMGHRRAKGVDAGRVLTSGVGGARMCAHV